MKLPAGWYQQLFSHRVQLKRKRERHQFHMTAQRCFCNLVNQIPGARSSHGLDSASESWEALILTLLDESAVRSHQLEKLVRSINNAGSAAERQERRTEAKTWLMENKDRLTEEDHEMVLEHLSYLKID